MPADQPLRRPALAAVLRLGRRLPPRCVFETLAAAAALAILVSAIVVLAFDIQDREAHLHDITAETAQSQLTRLEIEHAELHTALYLTERGGMPLDRLRHDFADFSAQVKAVTETAPFGELLRRSGLEGQADRITDALREMANAFAGSDARLRAQLPELSRTVDAIEPDVRRYSAAGADLMVESHLNGHAHVERLETLLALIGLAVIVLLLAGVAALARLNHRMRSRSRTLRATTSRLNAVVTTALDAVIVTDEAGTVLEYNTAAEAIFGYDRDEVLGRPLEETLVPAALRADHPEVMARYRDAIRQGRDATGRFELPAQRKSGARFPAEISFGPAVTEEGTVLVTFLRDISERKRVETELTAARDRALAGEKAKARLLAVMSHEMRTPLNGLLGTMELLQRSGLDDAQRQYLDIMSCSGEILLHHVEDVLEVSRIDAGRSETRITDFDLPAKLKRLVALHQPLAAERDTRLGLEIGAGLGPAGLGIVRGDSQRLRQIVVNLISNAVKFTQGGRVTVSAMRPARDMVEIRVADTGIGIAPEDQPRIFDEFFIADATYKRETGGTGLGLAIVARQVKLLGGRIEVSSEPGQGSTFTVTLPLPRAAATAEPGATPQAAPAPEPAPAPVRRLDVLVVEDNRVNRFIARRLLEGLGHRVTEAVDGLDGVEAAAARAYDVILMDISMPRLDGVEAARRIRATNDCPPRIVAMTAHALPEDLARFRAAGMADVALKPVSGARLTEILVDIPGKAPVEPSNDVPDIRAEDETASAAALSGQGWGSQAEHRRSAAG
ncbi:ATP-binding protein [Rhodovulum sp. YEN HP10]|uniref:ATP-binding protein n=1 Tax=Rhodovulum sp. HP10 TaxID=3387397 RepID=UPI0039E1D320